MDVTRVILDLVNSRGRCSCNLSHLGFNDEDAVRAYARVSQPELLKIVKRRT
jgi:hypothetical protein